MTETFHLISKNTSIIWFLFVNCLIFLSLNFLTIRYSQPHFPYKPLEYLNDQLHQAYLQSLLSEINYFVSKEMFTKGFPPAMLSIVWIITRKCHIFGYHRIFTFSPVPLIDCSCFYLHVRFSKIHRAILYQFHSRKYGLFINTSINNSY